MSLGYAQNHTGVKYRLFIICTKRIVLSCDIIWLNKTYREYVSKRENTNKYSYNLQNEDDLYKWAHLKIDPVKNKDKTKNVKTEGKVKTKQYFNNKEEAQKIIKGFSFAKQENQVKQYHHEDIDKNVILALKKPDTSYNLASLNHINEKN